MKVEFCDSTSGQGYEEVWGRLTQTAESEL